MNLKVCVRSVLGNNAPAAVRPDLADVYIQNDIHGDAVNQPTGLWHKKLVKAKCNVSFLSGTLSGGDDVHVVNPFKGIFDVVWTSTNNEVSRDAQNYEDGRSRRYLLNTGTFYHLYSVPITDCHIPVTFTQLSQDDDFGIYRICSLRLARKHGVPCELLTVHLGGKNLPDRKAYDKERFSADIKNFMALAESVKHESQVWQKEGAGSAREYVILLHKDHSATADAFDVDSFLDRFGRSWHMPDKYDLFSCTGDTGGWYDIYGWYSSMKEATVDLCLSDYDDHSPAMFTLVLPLERVLPSEEKKYMQRYYISKKFKVGSKFKLHDESSVTELEYQRIRRGGGRVRYA